MKLAKQNIHKDSRTTVGDLNNRILQDLHGYDDETAQYLLDVTYILHDWSFDNKKGEANTNFIRCLRKKNDSFWKVLSPKTKTLISELSDSIEHLDFNHRKIFSSQCEECGSIYKVTDSKSCTEICTKCGLSVYIPLHAQAGVYSDTITPTTYFAYKRVNHFKEWLAQVQGKTNTDITVAMNAVKQEIQKERNVVNTSNITPSKIRAYLKKHKLGKYYEHVNRIHAVITGLSAPILTIEVEERLTSMFKLIQIPFDKHCPKTRNNFLSYSYTLNKMCQILHLDALLMYFPLLKSREKLHAQDSIWKNICSDVGWTFYPSL